MLMFDVGRSTFDFGPSALPIQTSNINITSNIQHRTSKHHELRPDPCLLTPVPAMILEGLVTTLNADGGVNIAPMGPIVDEAMRHLILRPYQTSRTYANL